MKNEKLITQLSILQADMQVLHQNLKNIHWNIKGLEFFEMHEQTEVVFEELEELIDKVAEKIVMNGSVALGNFSDILKISNVKEIATQKYNYKTATPLIIEALKTIINDTNDVEATPTVQPILDEVYLFADKYIWQFSALIEEV